jgi:phosphatidylinositol-bisphosphatase
LQGNKGGVAVSLRIHDTLLCFVNSHLAAGGDELLRRNQDFREISRITFSAPGRPTIFDHEYARSCFSALYTWFVRVAVHPCGSAISTTVSHNLTVAIWTTAKCAKPVSMVTALDCSSSIKCVRFLNSLQRISFDREVVFALVPPFSLKLVLTLDSNAGIVLQLVKMQQSKTAFHDFTEGKISFPPTYKYDPGTDNWDSRWVFFCLGLGLWKNDERLQREGASAGLVRPSAVDVTHGSRQAVAVPKCSRSEDQRPQAGRRRFHRDGKRSISFAHIFSQ